VRTSRSPNSPPYRQVTHIRQSTILLNGSEPPQRRTARRSTNVVPATYPSVRSYLERARPGAHRLSYETPNDSAMRRSPPQDPWRGCPVPHPPPPHPSGSCTSPCGITGWTVPAVCSASGRQQSSCDACWVGRKKSSRINSQLIASEGLREKLA
jgi:hypothetical protein